MDKSMTGSLVIKCSFLGTNHRINFVVIHCDWGKAFMNNPVTKLAQSNVQTHVTTPNIVGPTILTGFKL